MTERWYLFFWTILRMLSSQLRFLQKSAWKRLNNLRSSVMCIRRSDWSVRRNFASWLSCFEQGNDGGNAPDCTWYHPHSWFWVDLIFERLVFLSGPLILEKKWVDLLILSGPGVLPIFWVDLFMNLQKYVCCQIRLIVKSQTRLKSGCTKVDIRYMKKFYIPLYITSWCCILL